MDKNKVGYQQALMKNFESLGKEKVSVIHSAFGDKPHVVAFVDVNKTWTVTEKLEFAFEKTNSINDAWWTNEGITKMFDGATCRSTSVGDMVLLSSGKKYKVDACGWSEV